MRQRTLKILRFIVALSLISCVLVIMSVFTFEKQDFLGRIDIYREKREVILKYVVPEPTNLDNTTLQRRSKVKEVMLYQ